MTFTRGLLDFAVHLTKLSVCLTI